jgi:hypothetical protein
MSQVNHEWLKTEGQEHGIEQNCRALRGHHLNLCQRFPLAGYRKLINSDVSSISFQIPQRNSVASIYFLLASLCSTSLLERNQTNVIKWTQAGTVSCDSLLTLHDYNLAAAFPQTQFNFRCFRKSYLHFLANYNHFGIYGNIFASNPVISCTEIHNMPVTILSSNWLLLMCVCVCV